MSANELLPKRFGNTVSRRNSKTAAGYAKSLSYHDFPELALLRYQLVLRIFDFDRKH